MRLTSRSSGPTGIANTDTRCSSTSSVPLLWKRFGVLCSLAQTAWSTGKLNVSSQKLIESVWSHTSQEPSRKEALPCRMLGSILRRSSWWLHDRSTSCPFPGSSCQRSLDSRSRNPSPSNPQHKSPELCKGVQHLKHPYKYSPTPLSGTRSRNTWACRNFWALSERELRKSEIVHFLPHAWMRYRH